MRQLIALLYVWQVLHPMEIKYVFLKGHGSQAMAFLLPQYSPIVNYPQSPPRIFGTSDELLFLRLLV